MGCGEARFGRKGQKTLKIENFCLKDLVKCPSLTKYSATQLV